MMSMLTAYLNPNPNACLSTPGLKYHIPKINTHQLSSFAELRSHPIKNLAAASLLKYWSMLPHTHY